MYLRLNMELDLHYLLFVIFLFTHRVRPRNPPTRHLGSFARALMISQDKRHLFVTPFHVPSTYFKDTVPRPEVK